MTMTWMFLLVVLAAVCMFGAVVAVMVMVFRAATRQAGGSPNATRPTDETHAFMPPILPGDNSIHHQHLMDQAHSSPPAPSMPDSSPSSSFDSGASAPSSFDSGSSAPSCDSGGSGCG